MHSQAFRRALPGALAPLLALLLSVSAQATPVLHTLTGASTFSSGISSSGTVTLVTNLGNVSAPFSMSGSLADTPTGTIEVDWGAPGWNDSIAIPSNGIAVGGNPSGGASGSATGIDLFGLLSVNVGFQWTPGSLDVQGGDLLAPTVPSDGSTPGPGPWLASGPITASLILRGNLTVSVNGSSLGPVPYPMGAMPQSIAMTLERVGGFPGTGSQVGANIAVSGPLTLPPTQVFAGPGCVVTVLKSCALNISSVNVALSTGQLTNPSLDIWATSTTAIVPEPGSALLLGTAAGALLVDERVRRRAGRPGER